MKFILSLQNIDLTKIGEKLANESKRLEASGVADTNETILTRPAKKPRSGFIDALDNLK